MGGEPFVELGGEAVNYLTNKHWDKAYNKVTGVCGNKREDKREVIEETDTAPRSAISGQPSARRKQKNRLPSPEGSIEAWDKENSHYRRRDSQRSASLDRESEQSARVLRAYETERDDPQRRPETVLSQKDLRDSQRDSRMAYQNGYGGGSTMDAPNYDRRANSQQPPRTRYDDDDDSDYDERTGRRYRSTGRGYDDGYSDGRGYDREVVETERYRGPARNFDARRDSYGTSRSYGQNDGYSGAVTQYRRSTQDLDEYQSKRSRSRGRRNSERSRGRDRSRSYSGSRSRSRSEEHSGIRGKIDDTFDTSMKGLGVGLAGAVVGGLAGREFGHKHKNRDIIIGALIGGLGANAAENKWHNWKDGKERQLERDEDKVEQKWDGYDRRSRSAMR